MTDDNMTNKNEGEKLRGRKGDNEKKKKKTT